MMIQRDGLRGIGFDIGGTLLDYVEIPLDWSAHYVAAIEAVAAACGRRASSRSIDAASAALRMHNTRITPRRNEVADGMVIADLVRTLELDVTTHSQRATEAFFGYFRQSLRAYSESRNVLATLSARGVRVGALTDVPYGMPRTFVKRDLEDTDLAGVIPVLLTSVDVGWRKPEPAGYLRLASALGVEAGEMAYVGNERKDVEGAIAAGMTAVLISRGDAVPEWGQTHTIRDLRELLTLPIGAVGSR